MAEKDTRPPTKFLVQRWWVIRQRCADGRVKCMGYAANDPFQSLEGAVAHYRRALEGRWVDPTWEGWGVSADGAVTEIADRDVPAAPMPGHVRDALQHLEAYLASEIRPGGKRRNRTDSVSSAVVPHPAGELLSLGSPPKQSRQGGSGE